MLIAYVTTDEVNESLAMQMASQCGADVFPLSLADPSPNGQFDGIVYDLDYLPPARRQRVLEELLAGPGCHRVAVHSYHLDEDQAQRLRQTGVVVFRRLEEAVFRTLAGAVR